MKLQFTITIFLFAAVSIFSGQLDYGLKLIDKSGKTVTLKEYEGKPLFVVYYSMTCGKCKKAIADLSALMSKKNCVQVVGIVTSSEEEKKFLTDKVKRPFVSYYDKWKNFKTAYGIEQVPLLLVADAKGGVLYKDDSYYEESFYEILSAFNMKICDKT
ncbi:MAG: TlpA family protein disulfide reductase, partial [Fibrobacteres bacterium]|nr:TlpA family protein disulfide reductase [Fibrobacterota bacterium]